MKRFLHGLRYNSITFEIKEAVNAEYWEQYGFMYICWKCSPMSIMDLNGAGYETCYTAEFAPLTKRCDRCEKRTFLFTEVMWFPEGFFKGLESLDKSSFRPLSELLGDDE